MCRTVWTICFILCVTQGATPLAAQEFRFQADWLILSRNNDSGTPLLQGPDGFSSGTADYGFESGYRLTLGSSLYDYDIEAVFTQLDDWNSTTSRIPTNILVLDDTFNNPVVVPAPPANILAFRNAIFDAATTAAVGNDETTESEQVLLDTIRYSSASDLRSFELNFGTNRNTRWWSFGLGYQHLLFNDRSNLLMGGLFDALDTVDGNPLGLPNNGLAHASLTGSGLTLLSGAADGFDGAAVPMAGPDYLTMVFDGRAGNTLNGVQAIAGARFFPSDWLVIEAIGKAGLYHNRVQGYYRELYAGSGQDDSVYGRTFTDKKTVASFVGSAALRGIVPLTDYISLMAGYEVMFLTNVGLGAEQVRGIGTSPLGGATFSARADSHTIIHGGTVGLEVVW